MKTTQIQQVVAELTEKVFNSTQREFFAVTESHDQQLSVVRCATWEEADGLKDDRGFAITRSIYSRAGARTLDEATGSPRAMTPLEFYETVLADLTSVLTKAHLKLD